MGVENSENATRLLSYAKEKHNLEPLIVTCDFSPNLIKAIKNVFGEHVLQIDGFHVMQEINIGIRRDLLDYRNDLYRAEISDLLALHHWINEIQKEINSTGTCSKTILKEKPSQNSKTTRNQPYWDLTTKLLKLMRLSEPNIFQNKLTRFLINCEKDSNPNLVNYATSISDKLPKRDFTEKGMKRFKMLLLRKLKSFYRVFRFELGEESLKFHKDHWLIFLQPENLTTEGKKRLNGFLRKYPALNEYREMTLQLGEIYRVDTNDIDGHRIDKLRIKDYFSKKLKTAIHTIKRFKKAILRFTEVFKKDKTLSKSCRANREFANKAFKAPFRAGLNRTKINTTINKLQLQLGCEVRVFV